MIRIQSLALVLLGLAAFHSAPGQTNAPAISAGDSPSNAVSTLERSEQIRARCLAERRSICGKILRIFPNGILVESGYTNLIRAPLTKSWLVPGTVTAARAQNLVETHEPGALCIGMVLVTDLPRGRPHPYDYVIMGAYPTGEFTYTSVGTVRKTVRRFSANLDKAVRANLAIAQEQAPHIRGN